MELVTAGFCEHVNELPVSTKMLGISTINEQLLAYQEEFCSMELDR
jgi:hypothetical protein